MQRSTCTTVLMFKLSIEDASFRREAIKQSQTNLTEQVFEHKACRMLWLTQSQTLCLQLMLVHYDWLTVSHEYVWNPLCIHYTIMQGPLCKTEDTVYVYANAQQHQA